MERGDGQGGWKACMVLVPFSWFSARGDFVVVSPSPWSVAVSRHIFVVTAGGVKAAGI